MILNFLHSSVRHSSFPQSFDHHDPTGADFRPSCAPYTPAAGPFGATAPPGTVTELCASDWDAGPALVVASGTAAVECSYPGPTGASAVVSCGFDGRNASDRKSTRLNSSHGP